MNSIYECLCTDGKLVLSGSPIDNTGRTDVDTDFGECELKDVDEEDETICPQWLSPYYNTTEDLPNANTDNIKTVNIVNRIKPTLVHIGFGSVLI